MAGRARLRAIAHSPDNWPAFGGNALLKASAKDAPPKWAAPPIVNENKRRYFADVKKTKRPDVEKRKKAG